MNYEQEINKLKAQVKNLQKSFLQAQKNQTPITARTDENSNNIKSLTPYTETKTGYFGETEKIFYNIPTGNVTVYGLSEYSLDRISDRLVISFDALTEQTDITISIL